MAETSTLMRWNDYASTVPYILLGSLQINGVSMFSVRATLPTIDTILLIAIISFVRLTSQPLCLLRRP